MANKNRTDASSVKTTIATWAMGALVLGALWSIQSLIQDAGAPKRHPSSVSPNDRGVQDLPRDEVEAIPTSKSFQSHPSAQPTDKRANILLDIFTAPTKSKALNGYGMYIGYRVQKGESKIDRFVYCQNIGDGSTAVNPKLNRYETTDPKRFPCYTLDIEQLRGGLPLIQFIGIEALKLQLDPQFDPKEGGIITISFLLKPVAFRQIQVKLRKRADGSFGVFTMKGQPTNELAIEFRDPGLMTAGYPSGVSTVEFFQRKDLNSPRLSYGKIPAEKLDKKQ